MKMYWEMVLAVVVLFTTTVAVVVEGDTEKYCRMRSCNIGASGIDGPTIHFPFWLKQSHEPQPAADDCGYPPAFQLSCRKSEYSYNHTIFEFRYLVNTSIPGLHLLFTFEGIAKSIDYVSHLLWFQDTPSIVNTVFVSNLTADSTPAFFIDHPKLPYPYTLERSYSYYYNYNNHDHYTFFNCSSSSWDHDYISFLSTPVFQIYAHNSNHLTIDVPFITSCTKMFNINWHLPYPFDPLRPGYYDPTDSFYLRWSAPMPTGGDCEPKYCNLPDTTGGLTDTYFPSPISDHPNGERLLPLTSLVIIFAVVFFLGNSIRLERQRKGDKLKIKMFMEDFKALKPTRYSYSDVKKITNQFKHKLGQGGYGSVFKGQISSDIQVAVKVLHSDSKANGDDFINEVGTIGTIHHVNVVRLLGYCADGCNRALVYEFQPNHSLEKFVYSRENHWSFIGWKKMQQIALGTAKGIEYLHQGCAQQILHFDIKPHNILLDRYFNPKISDFGLAKLCNKGQSKVSMTMARGTIGYIAPEVFSRNFGKVSAKSDVYSFGMLLLEMVGGKNNSNVDEVENDSEVYFPEWIYNRLEEGHQSIIQIENEDDSNIAKKLTVVGLWCIGWHPVDRPSMKVVIQMLERDDCPAMPPNPFSSTTTSAAAAHTKSNINDRLQVISESE